MKVSYNGRRYNIPPKSAATYYWLSSILFAKRIKRGIKNGIKFLYPVIILIPVWAVFLLFLNMIDKQGIFYYIDESKYSIFSSIVLAAVIRLQSQVADYRKNLKVQHELYVSLMHNTEQLIDSIIDNVLSVQDVTPHTRWSLYTNARYWKLRSELSACKISNNGMTTDLSTRISQVIDDCEKIKAMVSTNCLQSRSSIEYSFDSAYYGIKAFESTLKDKKTDIKAIEVLIASLFSLIEDMRYPWRRDMLINNQRRFIIAECTPVPDRGHYFNLFVEN